MLAALLIAGTMLLAADCELGEPSAGELAARTENSDHAAKLEALRSAYALDPDDRDLAVWIGRRLGYLGRYREAIEHYGEALAKWPDDPELLRHRGHRWITLRQFDCAIADLGRAKQRMANRPDAIEPDGLPNAVGVPRSSLQTNISYHLALAHYLRGDWPEAADEFARCHLLSGNDDMRVAAAYWWVLSLWRAGRVQAVGEVLAEIRPEMAVLENHDYHRLLLRFTGRNVAELPDPDAADSVASVTVLYGLSCLSEQVGDFARAKALRDRIVEGSSWAAFGSIAAEADVERSAE